MFSKEKKGRTQQQQTLVLRVMAVPEAIAHHGILRSGGREVAEGGPVVQCVRPFPSTWKLPTNYPR